MYYREAGKLVESFAKDRRMLPLVEDRWIAILFVAFMYLVVTFWANNYWLSAILIPMMVLSIASLGLNNCDGLYRSAFAGYSRLYVFRCLCRIQFITAN